MFWENVIHKGVFLRKKHLLFVKGRGMMQISYRWRLTVMNVIFNAAQWLKDNCAIYVEIDEKPFLIDKGGSIYDLSCEHLPSRLVVDYSEKLFREVDHFPFTGLKNRICQGCIYAKGINQFGEGCGKLFTRGFRNRYLKGVCEYRKTSAEQPSEHERNAHRRITT